MATDAAVKPLWQLAEGSIALFCLCIMPPNWRLPYLPQAASGFLALLAADAAVKPLWQPAEGAMCWGL